MLTAEGDSRRNLNIWIGGRMRCDLVPDVFHHVRKQRQGVTDTTAPLFIEYLTLYEMGRLRVLSSVLSFRKLFSKLHPEYDVV